MSLSNSTVELWYQGLLERVMFSSLATLPCCMFFLINIFMLYALRSKPVFCETSRYVLLYNLLFADTAQIVISQVLFQLATCRVILSYPLCGVFVMLANLTNEISPLTLVVMSLERYVAVCNPLRHTAIVTIRNAGVAVAAIWAFCLLNSLIRVLLLLQFPFEELESLQMKTLCTTLVMFLVPGAEFYDKVYTCVLFTSAGVAVVSSYIGVIIAARSASTNKGLASKARDTLLLHLGQLILSLSSTIFNPLILVVSKSVTRVVRVRFRNSLYVFIFILPRCLSSLIYGLRDRTIRSVLVYYVCFRLKAQVKSETSR